MALIRFRTRMILAKRIPSAACLQRTASVNSYPLYAAVILFGFPVSAEMMKPFPVPPLTLPYAKAPG